MFDASNQDIDMEVVATKSKVSKSDFQCDYCETKFKTKAKLERHIDAIHLLKKDHACELCGKRFGRKEHLERHVSGVHENIPKSPKNT